MEMKQIKAIVDLMKKNGLTVFSLEEEGMKITLERGARPDPGMPHTPAPAHDPAPTPHTPSDGPDPPDKSIDSPMVGTFYRAPTPDSPPFVKVGDKVGPDTVVCIIEAMKVMNEIKAETEGTIAEVLVENAKPVQFGEPMFRIH